jgi:hypothetical protein
MNKLQILNEVFEDDYCPVVRVDKFGETYTVYPKGDWQTMTATRLKLTIDELYNKFNAGINVCLYVNCFQIVWYS